MPLVNVMVNARAYTIACDEGEEEHLRELAGHVDSKVRQLLEEVGQVGDQRLLLMAALLITDEYFDAVARLESRGAEIGTLSGSQQELGERLKSAETMSASTFETAAKRLEVIAAKLANA